MLRLIVGEPSSAIAMLTICDDVLGDHRARPRQGAQSLNDHCDPSPLVALEKDDIAHTNVWIGDRVTF